MTSPDFAMPARSDALGDTERPGGENREDEVLDSQGVR